MSFPQLVQPILDRKCARCHAENEEAPALSAETSGEYGWSQAYQALGRLAWAKHGGNGSIRINQTSHSIAGQVGAKASKLYEMLTAGSHKDRAKLTDEEMRCITLWLDCNSNFYGAYHDPTAQAEGRTVMPDLW